MSGGDGMGVPLCANSFEPHHARMVHGVEGVHTPKSRCGDAGAVARCPVHREAIIGGDGMNDLPGASPDNHPDG
jgi:hypothetical protein